MKKKNSWWLKNNMTHIFDFFYRELNLKTKTLNLAVKNKLSDKNPKLKSVFC